MNVGPCRNLINIFLWVPGLGTEKVGKVYLDPKMIDVLFTSMSIPFSHEYPVIFLIIHFSGSIWKFMHLKIFPLIFQKLNESFTVELLPVKISLRMRTPSSVPNCESMPSSNSVRKKKADHSWGIGIERNASQNVIKARPGPLPIYKKIK